MYIETTPTDRLVTFRYQNDPDYGSEIIDFTQLKQDLVVTIQEQSGVWSADHSFAQIAEAVEQGVLVRLVDETNSRCAIIGEFGEDSFTFVTNDGQTCYAYTVTDADAWSLATSPVINIADDLTTDDPDVALSARQGVVLFQMLDGAPSIPIDLSSYTEGVGVIVTLTFHTSGNYGNWRYILIPVDAYRGRSLHIIPSSLPTQYIFLTDDALENNQAVNYADGYSSGLANLGSEGDKVVPDDASYLYLKTVNVATEEDRTPASITVNAIEGLQEQVDGKADKPASSTNGNLAALDGEGNLVDSASKPSDFASAEQGAKADAALPAANVKQATGTSSTNVMSQKAVTDALNLKADKAQTDPLRQTVKDDHNAVAELVGLLSQVPTDITGTTKSGYYAKTTGAFVDSSTAGYKCTELLDIHAADLLYVNSVVTSASVAAVSFFNQSQTPIAEGRVETMAQGGTVLNIPADAYYVGVSCKNAGTLEVKAIDYALDAYTKGQVDAKVQKRYGVKWSLTDFNDLGTRTLDAVGLTATAGVGNTDGASSFDNIYPWSEMRRCNIQVNANGAKVVTFEGETGFALDGSNGDVFVRIPKFRTSRYVQDGYMHLVIGDGEVHPAFIEGGEELDEIFVGAFEAAVVSSEMLSKGGVIPANNLKGADFLAAASARGKGYTMLDMRSVDAIWRLMAVEYGCRNSNRVFGYGYSDYRQPVSSDAALSVTVAASQSNTITGGHPSSETKRKQLLGEFAAGNNITICNGNQFTVVAQRKIVSVTCASTSDNLVVEFDGEPIDITTTMFFGNAPCDTNYCETIGDAYKLTWHTGRAARPIFTGSGKSEEAINPCRYRWIENPVGNVWQFLPDIKFSGLQMYVCKDMTLYALDDVLTNYQPIGALLPEQSSNGAKSDVNTVDTPNYWMTDMLNDIFSKGNAFGKAFDTVHDGTITSQKGYGGYYYLNTGDRLVVYGGGFDHLWRCNLLTFRAQVTKTQTWFLYGARLLFKNVA